jgi:SAM-dependent methyltransferase
MPGSEPNLRLLRERLISGTLSDRSFDRLYPGTVRAGSKQHWTPLSVAARAAALFREHGVRRVLDIGCGPGKFCVAAAVTQPELKLLGMERRPHLVAVAEQLGEQFALPNASFVHGDALERPWGRFDGFYFFNPFWENLSREKGRFDSTVELSRMRFLREQRRTRNALRSLRRGSLLISYHGIGAPIPSSYQLIVSEPAGTDLLRVWQRRSDTDEDWFHLEVDDSAIRVTSRQLAAAGRTSQGYLS